MKFFSIRAHRGNLILFSAASISEALLILKREKKMFDQGGGNSNYKNQFFIIFKTLIKFFKILRLSADKMASKFTALFAIPLERVSSHRFKVQNSLNASHPNATKMWTIINFHRFIPSLKSF